ncbi:MAG: sugar phosphate isomerase/epimerase family protein [Planctomycetia bacterium]|nr:sugar phosphate isomerase/epimerase family protein [Planctomycetia bacterium]
MEKKDKENQLNRRQLLIQGTIGTCLGFLTGQNYAHSQEEILFNQSNDSDKKSNSSLDSYSFRLCLNTGSLNGYHLTLEEELETARQANFHFVEIWINRLEDYLKRGKNIQDLKKWLDDNDLKIESAIGFATWIVDDPDRRRQGLDQMRREMEYLAQLGAQYIAAPASGFQNRQSHDLAVYADRYREILQMGDETNVYPLLEVWGTSPILSRLSNAMTIAAEAAHSQAALLLDTFHLFRGGNSFESLNLISGNAMPIFHINDYPAQPEREQQNDGHRVFPGDGVAPLSRILTILQKNGFKGALSLELFNDHYFKTMKPLELAQTGFQKMQKIRDSILS